MSSGTSLIAFVAAALVVLLIPGPGVLYVVARAAGQGYRTGLVSAAGLSLGALVHVFAATAGLSAMLLASAYSFHVVKMLGAGYLIYLGLRTLLTKGGTTGLRISSTDTLRRAFLDGAIVSVFNPKIAVFFLAFLPQFVDPDRAPIAQQFFLLGLVYCGLALVTDSAYATLAARIRHSLGARISRSPAPRWVSGATYLGLGFYTAFTGNRT